MAEVKRGELELLTNAIDETLASLGKLMNELYRFKENLVAQHNKGRI